MIFLLQLNYYSSELCSLKQIAPQGLCRRPALVTPEMVALAILGGLALLAVLWGWSSPRVETPQHVVTKPNPPDCYSIGNRVAAGCFEKK